MEVDIVRIVAMVYTVFSLSLNGLNDLDHHKSGENILVLIFMFDIHELSESHWGFIG